MRTVIIFRMLVYLKEAREVIHLGFLFNCVWDEGEIEIESVIQFNLFFLYLLLSSVSCDIRKEEG